MANAALALLVLAIVACLSDASPRTLNSRGFVEFGSMIHQATGKCWSHYMGYGNYCGPGGSGAVLDETDACCHAHDQCYDALRDRGHCTGPWGWFGSIAAYLHPIKWTLNADKTVSCDAGQKECPAGLCECDRIMVECIRHAEFNTQHAPPLMQDKPDSTNPDSWFCMS